MGGPGGLDGGRAPAGVGIAYVVPGGATRLRRALVSAGLQRAAMLLNVPDAVHPRYLVPVGTVAERGALTGGIPINRRKRLIALGLGTRGRAVLVRRGLVHRRDLTVPLAAWLFDPEQLNRRQGSVLIAAQEEAQGAILYRFGGQPDPEVVGKVSPGAAAELDALRSVAPGAGAAGVHTPATIGAGCLGTLPYVVLSFLGGRRAAELVGRGEIEACRTPDMDRRLAGTVESSLLAHSSRQRRRPRAVPLRPGVAGGR